MKNLLNLIMAFAIFISLANCTAEPLEVFEEDLQEETLLFSALVTPCTNADPKARLTNDSNEISSMEIYNEQGALIEHAYDIEPGETSDWKSFPAGEIAFKISTAVSEKIIVIDMSNCSAYDVAIDENNQLNTDAPNAVD